MKTIQIQIQPGTDTSTFDIYTDSDSYTNPIHFNISKNELINGYTSTIVPDNATIIKVSSNSIICPDQFILIPISTTTTTTTTTNSSQTSVDIYPTYNGTWTLSQLKINASNAFSSTRNATSATTIYDNLSYSSGSIESSMTDTPMGPLVTISRYYMLIRVIDLIGNGITPINISDINLKIYINPSNGPITSTILLDLYEAGTSLVEGNLPRYRSYLTSNELITTPNIKIGTISVDMHGYYTFNFNNYGKSVISQRVQNNEDITLAIVTRFDSDNISPFENPPNVPISFSSILEPDTSKYPRLEITTI